MNIFHKTCPCCGTDINILKTLKLINGCKSIINKKCFYCPSCDRKIGKEHDVKTSFIIQIGSIFGIIYLVNSLGTYFNISLYIYPFLYFLFFYLSLIIFVSFYPFQCYEQEEFELLRAPHEEFYSPVENARIDDFEKTLMKSFAIAPGIFIFIVFAVLMIGVLRSF